VARLILLNGPPGIGKSTLAQRFVDEHPLALHLDLDAVRAMLGGWMDHQPESGAAARALGLTMARQHLTAGHDVVVPQLLARVAFIEALEHVAAEVGATFHEIVLLDTKEHAVRRFLDRSQRRAAAGVSDAAGQMVQQQGGAEAIEATYDRLRAVIEARTHAVVITSEDGEIDRAYAALHQAIAT